jgi:serine/threonine protein kinase
MSISPFVVDLGKYEESRLLGEGQFGRVFLGIEKATRREVAIKHIKTPLSSEIDSQQVFIRELEILALNKHPGTLQLVGFRFITDPTRGPTIVTDIMEKGALSAILKEERRGTGSFFDATAKSICVFGIAAAMAYVHSNGVLHRDLKPENVFLTAELEPVVADFGISRHCTSNLGQTSNLGTPLYMAPELLNDEHGYSFPVDVYAFGVTLYSLFADPGELDDSTRPYRSAQQLMLRIGRGARFVRKTVISDYYWDLITECWKQGPETRPTFKTLMDAFHNTHEYIFPDADRAKVLAYEEKVYRRVGPPRMLNFGDRFLSEDEGREYVERLETLLTAPPPSRAQLRVPTLPPLTQSGFLGA